MSNATTTKPTPTTTVRAHVENIGGAVCAVFEFDAATKRDAKTFAETIGAWIGQSGADASGSFVARRLVGTPRVAGNMGTGAECVVRFVRDEAARAGFRFVW